MDETNSKMFAWSGNDFIRSLTTSIFVAGVATIYGLTSQADFDLFTTDWGVVLKLVINSSVITFIARMSEKFVTDGNGRVFGVLG